MITESMISTGVTILESSWSNRNDPISVKSYSDKNLRLLNLHELDSTIHRNLSRRKKSDAIYIFRVIPFNSFPVLTS